MFLAILFFNQTEYFAWAIVYILGVSWSGFLHAFLKFWPKVTILPGLQPLRRGQFWQFSKCSHFSNISYFDQFVSWLSFCARVCGRRYFRCFFWIFCNQFFVYVSAGLNISCFLINFRALYFWSCAQVSAGPNVLRFFSAFC